MLTPFVRLLTLSHILTCIVAVCLYAQVPDKTQRGNQHDGHVTAGVPRYQLLNINNITTWQRSDGQSNHSPTSGLGVLYPRGTAWAIYQDGFVWGGKAFLDSNHTIPAPGQLIRVGGATYNIGTRAGWVIGQGATAEPVDPSHPDARIYRIRRDYAQMSIEELRRDASEYFEIPLSHVFPIHVTAMYDQYETDWASWPVHLGGPYIERNGIPGYQPPPPFGPTFTVDSLSAGNYDEPGIAGANVRLPADQVLWTVFNDLDSTTTVSLYGSWPLGLEAQVTIWGYKRAGAIGETYFKRLRLINKGGVTTGPGTRGSFYIDSMYIAQWSDPDLGYFGDDLAGCDTALNLAFVYNGSSMDAEYARFNLPPPAFAYALAQGPLVPGAPGDSGMFNFSRVQGMKNRAMTSFGYFFAGGPGEIPYTREGALRWWRLFQGYVPDGGNLPRLYPHPPGEPVSTFPLNGDPVHRTGFIDGLGTTYSFPPGDRRVVLNTGPFNLAPGDTQEVIIAAVGGIGVNHLQSVAKMKSNARTSVQTVQNLLALLPPLVSDIVTYPNSAEATVRLYADARGTHTQSLQATLATRSGSIVAVLDLYDDGTHGDTLAGDNIWTNQVTIPRQSGGLSVKLSGIDGIAGPFMWNRIHERITTAGPLTLRSLKVFADNINNDGIANPGEHVRYGFTILNSTITPLSSLQITTRPEVNGKSRNIPALAIGSVDSMVYNPSTSESFFTISVPSNFADTMLTIAVSADDVDGNRWNMNTYLPVFEPGFPLNRALLEHITGSATGEFEILIVDPPSVQNHLYRLEGIDSLDSWYGFTLRNLTTNTILLDRHPLPDSIGFNVPVTEGFRVRLGTLETRGGMKGWNVPAGDLRFSWLNGDFFFEGFNGAIGWDDPCHYFGQCFNRAVRPHQLKNVLLKLADAVSSTNGNPNTGYPYGGWDPVTTTDPNMSYAYRYLRLATASPARPEFAPFIVNPSGGYAYQDYKKSVPFSAWDVDTTPPRRLAVGFLENNVVNALVDGLYWPPPSEGSVGNVAGSGPREWFFIFNTDYTGQAPDPALMVNILSNPVPVMWWGTVTRLGGTNFFTGDEFLIHAARTISSSDVWTFNPTIVVGLPDEPLPFAFALEQNYPNPFNPTTTIQYQLPVQSKVTIKIYNILGQEIRNLVEEVRPAGAHAAVWDGTNRTGTAVATGVYFYRIEARSMDGSGAVFARVNKMMMLK
jgi:hypothetical protein